MAQYARSLIEASLDPLVTISADGKITDVNEATTKVTSVSRELLIGTDFSNYFTEPEKAQEGYRQVFAKGMVTDSADHSPRRRTAGRRALQRLGLSRRTRRGAGHLRCSPRHYWTQEGGGEVPEFP
jgi:PAS domain S-box-containing protein